MVCNATGDRFWLFESTILVSYLSTLRSDLQHDRALIELVLRQSNLAEAQSQFEAMYVRQDYGEQVYRAEVAARLLRPVQITSEQVKLRQLSAFESTMAELTAVANYLETAKRLAPGEHAPASIAGHLLTALRDDWKNAYEAYVGGLIREHAKLPKELRRTSSPQLPSERQAVVDINMSPKTREWQERAESLRSNVAALLTSDCNATNALAAETGDAATLIRTDKFLAFCRLQNLQEDAPGSVLFASSGRVRNISVDASFLGGGMPIVSLVGPAGFGKTSFCKWQALTSAANLLGKQDDILPVYVPLYRFASHVPTAAADAFFESQELQQLVVDPSRKTRIRLFLDGLDEIPNPQRQREMVDLARSVSQQVPDCQVIITARDHVRGAWLDGIPRLRVNPLNAEQQRTLVQNWLGSAEATDKFFKQLPPSLRALMGVPLLSTLTAAVYKKHQYLPANRTALYVLFVELLCGGWDAVKGTNRGSRFGIHDKQTVLKSLAGMNHLSGRRDAPIDGFRAAVRSSLSGMIDHEDVSSQRDVAGWPNRKHWRRHQV